MSGDKIELPADLRAKIEKVPEQIEVDLLYCWTDDKFDRSNALDLARECALRAATLAVEHERELVCEECGKAWVKQMDVNGVPFEDCPGMHRYTLGFHAITRAEFERRKETK